MVFPNPVTYYKHLSSSPTGCKKDMENTKKYEDKDWKCIEMKNNFVSNLRKNNTSNLPVFYWCY